MPTFVWMMMRSRSYFVEFVCLRHPDIVGRPFGPNTCPRCEEDRAQWRAHFGILAEQAEGGVL